MESEKIVIPQDLFESIFEVDISKLNFLEDSWGLKINKTCVWIIDNIFGYIEFSADKDKSICLTLDKKDIENIEDTSFCFHSIEIEKNTFNICYKAENEEYANLCAIIEYLKGNLEK